MNKLNGLVIGLICELQQFATLFLYKDKLM